MYRGFNIKLDLTKDEAYKAMHNIGEKLYKNLSIKVNGEMQSFIDAENYIDGSLIQSSWFPQIEADIFISHSHKNLDDALVLAGWLNKKFGLKAFVDSSIWGYSNDLLREIDNNYCYIPERGIYDYNLRNHSTAHIHMMLAAALSAMIDKAECLFFINTPESIKSYREIDKTNSAWIYFEMETAKVIRKKEPIRAMNENFSNYDGNDKIRKGANIVYDLNLDCLTSMKFDDLKSWENQPKMGMHALDVLYSLFPE